MVTVAYYIVATAEGIKIKFLPFVIFWEEKRKRIKIKLNKADPETECVVVAQNLTNFSYYTRLLIRAFFMRT